MLGVLRTAAPQQHTPSDTQRVKFRTVLGLGTLNKDSELSRRKSSATTSTQSRSFSRRSVDVVSGSLKRQHRRNQSSVVDPSFFTPDVPASAESTAQPSDMPTIRNSVVQSQPTRRIPVRAENQDGPWTVSVAKRRPTNPTRTASTLRVSVYPSYLCLARTNSPAFLPATPSSIRSHTRPHFHSNGFYVKELYANPLAIL